MEQLYHTIVLSLRNILSRLLDLHLDLDQFLAQVARSAKDLDQEDLEARVYEVNFIENMLFLRTSTHVDVSILSAAERTIDIQPHTITGDAIIENRVVAASQGEGYGRSRFVEGQAVRAAFPIEFHDPEMPEGRTKYVLVVDKKGPGRLDPEVVDALRDFSILAGLAISIKELRDKLSDYYEKNQNLVLTGRHSASIAHDIRSLNLGVGGYLQSALKRLSKSDRADQDLVVRFMKLALENAEQVEVLLKNFAQFNRTEIELNRDTDLAQALARKIESLKNRQDWGRRVKFSLHLPKDETTFRVDPDWFGTVLENLVRNSVEACRGPAAIEIDLKKSDGEVTLTFKDNCGGLPQEILPELFTPFRTTKRRGQGLGLANVKKVVNDHGGDISIVNEPGRGVVFNLKFPLGQGRNKSPSG
ncbi:MAG: HAMP domain-containing sensor histidine kinase [Thermodesulfobacteriota bacterium]